MTLLLFAGCQKDEALPADNSSGKIGNVQKLTFTETANAIYHYRLDDAPAEEGAFTVEEGSPLHFVLTDAPKLNGKDIFTIHAFTSKQGYLNYCNSQGMPSEEVDEIEEHLDNYAITSGAAAIEATTGVIPQSFIDYADTYVAQFSPVGGNTQILRQNCAGVNTGGPSSGPQSLGINGFVFALPWPFNDSVESFNNALLAFTQFGMGFMQEQDLELACLLVGQDIPIGFVLKGLSLA
ncbi:MAG: hypothetical protein IPN76_22680 [Saprospiraceae bacterium]|nr:hypothetical protein [Saprospiraceae bacterium]